MSLNFKEPKVSNSGSGAMPVAMKIYFSSMLAIAVLVVLIGSIRMLDSTHFPAWIAVALICFVVVAFGSILFLVWRS